MNPLTPKYRIVAGPIVVAVIAIGMLLTLPRMAKADTNVGNVMEKLLVDQTYQADEKGNLVVTIKMAFSAKTWPFWTQNFQSNPSLFKRNMAKYVGKLDVYFWDIKDNAMDRTVTVTIKAHGAVDYKGDGLFQYTVLKEWGDGVRSGNTYTFNFTNVENADFADVNTIHLIMPDAATNIKDDFSGNPRTISYTLPIVSESHAGLMTGGIFLVVLGIGALIAGFVMPGKAVPTRVAISAIQSRVLPPQTRSALPPAAQPAASPHYSPAAAPAQAAVQQPPPPPGTRDFRPPVD